MLVDNESFKRWQTVEGRNNKEDRDRYKMRLPLAYFHVLFVTGGQNNAILPHRMTKARFLWRVAFLCNLCYVLSIYLRMNPSNNYGSFQSSILIMGTILGFTLNILSLALFCWSVSRNKQWEDGMRWLPISNAAFLLLQIIDMLL
jgi:hypothetical protein